MANVPYRSVHVAIINWEKHDLGRDLDDELNDLEKTFSQTFGFPVTRILISGTDSQNSLSTQLERFYQNIAAPAPPTLVIVVYGGHGDPQGREDWGRKCVWAQTRHMGCPEVSWLELEKRYVTRFNYDQLLILDCCYAANAVPAHVFGSTLDEMLESLKGTDNSELAVSLHLLAASDFRHKSFSGENSFTKRLDRALNGLARYAFTVDDLRDWIGGVTKMDQLPGSQTKCEIPKHTNAVHYPIRRAKTTYCIQQLA